MIRSILRTFSRFLMAIVLLGLILCAVEVWFRWERVQTGKQKNSNLNFVEKLVLPSSTTWLDVAPLIETSIPVSLSESTPLRTNSFATRGDELEMPKPGDRFRVLCLGGESVFGLGQTEEETIPAQLQALFQEAKLDHVEFVNAGCPGAGPLTQYLRFRSRFVALDPDLILFCLSPEDIHRDVEVRGGLSLDDLGKPAYATHPATQFQATDELNLLCQEFATVDWVTTQLGPMLGLRSPNAATENTDDQTQSSFQPLLDIKHLASSQGCKLMISVLPNAWSLKPQTGAVSSKNVLAFERDLHTFFADHGIQSTSLIHNSMQVFQQNEEFHNVFAEGTGHLNALGNVIYARTLAKSMVDFFPEILNVPNTNKQNDSELPITPIQPPLLNESGNGPLTNQNGQLRSLIR